MALCLGFTVGPLGGALLQASFGTGSSNTDEESFRYTCLCMGCICLLVIPLIIIYLKPDNNSNTNTNTKSNTTSIASEQHKVYDFTRRISMDHNAASPKVTIAEFR